VFSHEVTTKQIFDSQIKQIVHSALTGVNQTVFAYGQTSSGKTYTMRGPSLKEKKSQQEGLIPLSVKEIFECVSKDSSSEYKITVSYLEVSAKFNS
jgi:hypothetical protein